VFWHKPRFACLDECTSAVALDGEEEMYSHIKELGCTVLTASQKPWLTNFHSHILNLIADGEGGWSFKAIEEGDRFTGLTRLDSSAYVDNRQEASHSSSAVPEIVRLLHDLSCDNEAAAVVAAHANAARGKNRLSERPMGTRRNDDLPTSGKAVQKVEADESSEAREVGGVKEANQTLRPARAQLEAEAEELFSRIDRNGNGELTKSELKNFLSKEPELKDRLMQGKGYKELFSSLDQNGNGRFSVKEFKDFFVFKFS